MGRIPPRSVLAALLVLAVAPPFVAQASGSVVGSFTMFHRIVRYHLDLSVVGSDGEHRVSVRSLRPHLSPEARNIVLPADGYAVGADQVDVVAAGLPEFARLLCDLHPGALTARARLVQDPFDTGATRVREKELPCPSASR